MTTIKNILNLIVGVFALPFLSFVLGWMIIIIAPFAAMVAGAVFLAGSAFGRLIIEIPTPAHMPFSAELESYTSKIKFLSMAILYALALPVVTFVAAWGIIIMAPIISAAAGIFLIAVMMGYIMKEIWLVPVRLATEAEVLGMRGLPQDESLNHFFRLELLNVLRYSPFRTQNKACFCIKKTEKDYIGVLRIGHPEGNFFQKIHGYTKEQVLDKFIDKFYEYKHKYPVRKGKRLIETKDCNSQLCPIGAINMFPMKNMKRIIAV
ncbi:MAG: hypothetical protein OEZ22_14590 [Spirochaetia bacterium]|nr:hypothetical protein [Spirochaetia bacterium]